MMSTAISRFEAFKLTRAKAVRQQKASNDCGLFFMKFMEAMLHDYKVLEVFQKNMETFCIEIGQRLYHARTIDILILLFFYSTFA